MTISFTPALGEIVRIPVTADAVSVRLRFTAVLLVRDYRYYERNGAKLQIWSDIPTINEMDGWKAFDFEDPKDGEELEQDYDQVILPFAVNAPVKPGTKFFSFTYRILYPTGKVHWLGVPDRNGAFIVRRQKMRENAKLLSPPERVEPVSPPLQEQNQEAGVPSPRATSNNALLPGSMGNPSTNDFESDMRPLRLRQRKVAPTPTLSMLNSDVFPTLTAAGPSVDTHLAMPGGLLECDVLGEESNFGEQKPGDLPISPSVDPEEILRFWRDESVKAFYRLVLNTFDRFVPHRPPPNPPSASQPPSSTLPHIPDPIESRVLRSTPLTVWGWVLDETVYVPGSLPFCRTLSDRYERFHKAIKTAKVGEAARFKGFVSFDDSRNPVSQFCFHFASNRNEKDMRRRLTRTEIARLMEAAGTSRQPTWIEIPGSESPQYLPVAAPLHSYLHDSDVDV